MTDNEEKAEKEETTAWKKEKKAEKAAPKKEGKDNLVGMALFDNFRHRRCYWLLVDTKALLLWKRDYKSRNYQNYSAL